MCPVSVSALFIQILYLFFTFLYFFYCTYMDLYSDMFWMQKHVFHKIDMQSFNTSIWRTVCEFHFCIYCHFPTFPSAFLNQKIFFISFSSLSFFFYTSVYTSAVASYNILYYISAYLHYSWSTNTKKAAVKKNLACIEWVVLQQLLLQYVSMLSTMKIVL